VILQVRDVNDPPRLQGEADFTMVGQPIIVDVLANDVDVDGHLNPGTVMLLDEPRLGQAEPDPITGELVYEAARSGTERLRYRICDDDGDCEAALLVVDVAPNPDQEEEEFAEEEVIAAIDPQLEEDFLDQWIEEELYEIPTPANRQIDVSSGLEAHLGFEAPEGFKLEVLVSPSRGLAWMNKGQIVYRSIPQFEGEDLLRYVWVDMEGRRSEPAEVRISVNAIPIDVPEAFTPNGDGINDIFRIGGLADWPNCEVRIYDRSQRLVKVMRGPDDSWDGTMRGKDLMGDTYFLVVDYDRRDKNSPQYRGFTTIVR
jgi:gliding motility-associated-like protein